jgi:integrase
MRVETFKTGKRATRYILVDSFGAPIEPVLHFLRFKDNCGRARNTLKAYCFHLRLYFEYLEAIGTAFEDVGIDELAGFLRWMQSGGNGKVVPINNTPTRSARTINVYLSTVYAFYDYLSRHEDYSLRLSDKLSHVLPVSKRGFKDFLYHVNKSKQFDSYVIKLKEPKLRPKVIKKSDVEAVLSECRTSRDRFLVQLLWESGLRIGEALALWLEDIEPDARRVHVRDRGELENLSEIKTVCSPRIVDVSADLVNLFFDYIADAHTEEVDTNHVFIKLSGSRKGEPLDYSDAAALIRRLRGRAGVNFTAHMLRHSSFSELRRIGWPVEQLQARAGHAFVQSTYVYLHSDDEELRMQWEQSEQQMNLRKGEDDNEAGV